MVLLSSQFAVEKNDQSIFLFFILKRLELSNLRLGFLQISNQFHSLSIKYSKNTGYRYIGNNLQKVVDQP